MHFRNVRDPYLIKLEQMLRALCLKLTVSDSLLNPLPSGCTFQIHMHTTETSSIEIQKDTEVYQYYLIYFVVIILLSWKNKFSITSGQCNSPNLFLFHSLSKANGCNQII